MKEIETINGRDVCISIDGKQVFQAEKVEINTLCDIHSVRSCVCNDDIAHIKGRKIYKASMTALKFKKPFENCNFYDLDNFTVTMEIDGAKITLTGCVWNEIFSSADKERFREKVSLTALRMNVEETE